MTNHTPTPHTTNHDEQAHGPAHTPQKSKALRNTLALTGAAALGVITTLGMQGCDKKKGNHFDPINTRGGIEQMEYDNHMTEVSMERVIDSLMMIQGTHTSLQTDAFQGLYNWLNQDVFEGKKSIWKPMTWFDNSKHAHKNGNMKTHYEMMIDEINGEKVIVVRWHSPTPTAAQKANGHVSDHKVGFSQYAEGDTRIKRTDYYSDKQHPQRTYITTFSDFKEALEELGPVFK